MTTHLSKEIVERFHAQALAGGDRAVIYDHILGCESCRLLIVDARTHSIAIRTLSEHLLPRESEETYHLDYETIEAFVDEKLDTTDRSTARLHLEDCAECSAEIEDLRESLAMMRAASAGQTGRQTVSREGLLKRLPVFARPLRFSAAVAALILLVIGVIAVWKFKVGSNQTAPKTGVSAGSQPTPLPPPAANAPRNATSPSRVEAPNKFAENKPSERQTAPRQDAIALKDGNSQVALDYAGNLTGLESAPAESQQAVKKVLSGETIERPDVLDELTVTNVSLRASTGNEEPIRIVHPANAVITQDRPTIEWTPSKTAQAYRVEIGDPAFHQVAKSEDLPATSRTWAPTKPLKRGIVYTWTIQAVNTHGETATSSQGKFKVLAEDKARELDRLKTASNSHLALGVFYAREGMIAEAKREFQILAKENPGARIVIKLLRRIDSWQKR